MDFVRRVVPFISYRLKGTRRGGVMKYFSFFFHRSTRMIRTSATSSINKVLFVIAGNVKMSYYVNQTAKDGRRSRGQGRFACDNCDRRYHQMKNLRRHVTNECGKQPMHQCSFCPYRATYKSYLQVHMMKHAKHGFVPRITLTTFKHQDS